MIQKLSHSTAISIALSPCISSLEVLHTEKQAFQCAALQNWEIMPWDIASICTGVVEHCNASRLPTLQF